MRSLCSHVRLSSKDPRRASERDEPSIIAGQSFIPTDHKIALRKESIPNAQQNLLLERQRKVGEWNIAAENKIKRAGWRAQSQILLQEFDTLAILALQAIKRIFTIEGLVKKRRWQFTKASRRKARFTGAPAWPYRYP